MRINNNKKYNSWLNALISLFFIAVPAIIGLFFVLEDYPNQVIDYYWSWIIFIGLIVYVAALSFVFIHFDLLPIESLAFNVPLTIVFGILFVSYPLPLWAMFILVIIGIISAFPTNILITKIKKHKFIKHQSQEKKK